MKLAGLTLVMLAPTAVGVWTVRHIDVTGAENGVVWLVVLLGLVLTLLTAGAIVENRL